MGPGVLDSPAHELALLVGRFKGAFANQATLSMQIRPTRLQCEKQCKRLMGA